KILGLENGTLLDMELEIGGRRFAWHRPMAAIADPFELISEAKAGGVTALSRLIPLRQTGEDGGADHGRGKPCAFLIRPIDEIDRMIGLNVGVPQRPENLQCREHPEDAVKAPAHGLGVEMAADHD